MTVLDQENGEVNSNESTDKNQSRNNGYWNGEPLPRGAIKALNTLGVITAMGSALVACNKRDDLANRNISEPVPITEPHIVNNNLGRDSEFVMYEGNELVVEKPVYEEVDWEQIEDWPTLEPLEIAETEDSVEVVKPTEALIIPVTNDYFYNTKKDPTLIEIPAGTDIEIENIYSFKGEDDQIVRFTMLPNIMGTRGVPILILDSGHIDNGEYVIDSQNYKKAHSQESLASFSYLVGQEEIYPNKINNVLVAMENIAKRQEAEGMFIKGQEYSYIDLIGLDNLQKFKDGYTSSRAVVRGGGVCAGATLLSNTLYGLAENSNVSWEDTVIERWEHSSRYYLSPFATNDFVTDATVEILNDKQRKDYDFRWIQPEDGFLKIDMMMVPNGLSFSDTESSGVGGGSDVEFMVTLSFTKEDPGPQAEQIRAYIEAYEEYRDSKHESVNPLLDESEEVQKLDWEDSKLQTIIDFVYPEENVANFEEELHNGEGLLSEIEDLRDVVNSLPEDFPGNLGDYLATTSWYAENEHSEDLDAALRMLNYTDVEGQPLQCVGFAVLLSAMTQGDINIQNVGGASSFGNGSIPAGTATELVPYKLLNDPYLFISSTGYGGVAIASKDMSIEDYKIGDLFIRADVGGYNNGEAPDGTKITYQTGHIGAIIGRKVVNGETVLLVADSNRKNDGEIMIFEVTEHNFYKIFGDPGIRKYIIRSAANAGN